VHRKRHSSYTTTLPFGRRILSLSPTALTSLALASALACSSAPESARSEAAPAHASMNRPAEGQQVILITGSTDGLGREVARRLASTGAHIIVHGRNQVRGAEVVAEIEKEGKGSARFYAADLGELAQVRNFANTILRDYDRLDVLINNAGIWARTAESRELSADGHELSFAVNYLSGYLLTRTLLPLITKSAPSRIVNVSSTAQTPIDFDDVMLERNFSGGRAYGQSKLAQILFTFDLARELEGKGVIVNAVHPASLMATSMVREAGVTPRTTVDEGATAVMNLVTTPGLESGQYFNGLRPARANAQAYDEEARARLRQLSRELTGVD
jgi:NAD(P)-dependent dehydrogenase (short-subunit alcohol dehydrogenase family)